MPASPLLLAGVIVACVFAYIEIQGLFVVEQNWKSLLAPPGLITVIVYVVLLVWGLIGLFLAFLRSDAVKRPSKFLGPFSLLCWLVFVALLLSIVWFYLYSPWQALWPGPWTQLLFAAGLALWIGWLASPQRGLRFGLSELVLTSFLFAYPRVILDVRSLWPSPFVYRGATVLGFVFLFALVIALHTPLGGKIQNSLISARIRLGRWRWILVILLAASPLLLRFAFGLATYETSPNLRFGLLLIALWLMACLAGGEAQSVSTATDLLVAALALSVGFSVTYYLLTVVNYPFSLTWSEGNRFYDYSLVFGQSLYQYNGTIINPYNSPGRYGLWGVLFLIQGLPIWVHRLWDVLIRTLLPILLGWTLSRHIEEKVTRLVFFLWVSVFFIIQAPVHPPFVLSFIVALLFGFESSLFVRAVSLFIASYYIGLSRYTWVVAPASWGVLIDLFLYYPKRNGSYFQKLWPTLVILASGLIPGAIINADRFLSISAGQSPISNQPLLWYRLLPNPTYPLGVGPAMLLTTGPLLIILIWLVFSGKWKTDRIQRIAMIGSLTGFLVVGLIISAKIGGGGDLHNLDMYLAALILMIALGLRLLADQGKLDFRRWPFGIQAMLSILLIVSATLFTPFTTYMQNSPVDDLPASTDTSRTLASIRTEVSRAASQGEVLFMDQRQLITFEYIRNVPFVPEYEKKYMMDQAMGDNSSYFQSYYRDLADNRFDLIVTEILTSRYENLASFSEENNAWVKWISIPTLCFYEPVAVYKNVNVELLRPRQNPIGCDIYLAH